MNFWAQTLQNMFSNAGGCMNNMPWSPNGFGDFQNQCQGMFMNSFFTTPYQDYSSWGVGNQFLSVWSQPGYEPTTYTSTRKSKEKSTKTESETKPEPKPTEKPEAKASEFDTDSNGVVTVKEQKASIAEQLKNVWISDIARFFKDDIKYDINDSSKVTEITQQVKARIKNALDYIEYAKKHNIDIFYDNTGTGVDDVDGELQEYTDSSGASSKTLANPGAKSSVKNNDGTVTDSYNNGTTTTWNENCLKLADTGTSGKFTYEQTYDYNEDGSYVYHTTYNDSAAYHGAYDKNNQEIGSYYVTENGNYNAHARKGETLEQTLTRLGITDSDDIKAIKKANPKATRNGKFKVIDSNYAGDVFIPKSVIENMKANGTYDETKLMS